jgi:hypothetical protein
MTYYEFFMGTITFGGYNLWRLIRQIEEKNKFIEKKKNLAS